MGIFNQKDTAQNDIPSYDVTTNPFYYTDLTVLICSCIIPLAFQQLQARKLHGGTYYGNRVYCEKVD